MCIVNNNNNNVDDDDHCDERYIFAQFLFTISEKVYFGIFVEKAKRISEKSFHRKMNK